jgi:hypothetical protein
MKVLFVGPSLYGSDVDLSGLDVRPPAAQGDVLAAIRGGATAIGLIDGEFGQRAAVWHKEILLALDQGIEVYGASSMGALRAAECAPFGMIPVGAIANAYLDGLLDDDAAVALTMAPAEMGSVPLTEPQVDAEATLAHLLALNIIDPATHSDLVARAGALHFTERTDEALMQFHPHLLAAYRHHHVSQKRLDAEELVEILRAAGSRTNRPSFRIAPSVFWRDLVPV